MLTGESWSEAIARPLIMGADEINAGAVSPFIASIFFIVFILLNSVVLINVVVAVLLEKMVEDPPVRPAPATPLGPGERGHSPCSLRGRVFITATA